MSAYTRAVVNCLTHSQLDLGEAAFAMRGQGCPSMSAARLTDIIDGAYPTIVERAVIREILRVSVEPKRLSSPVRLSADQSPPQTRAKVRTRAPAPDDLAASTSPPVPSPPPVPARDKAKAPLLGNHGDHFISLDGLAVWAAGEAGRRSSIRGLQLPASRLSEARKQVGVPATVPTAATDLIAGVRLGIGGWDAVERWVPARLDRPSPPSWSTFDQLDGAAVLGMLAGCGGQPDRASEVVLVALLIRSLSEGRVARSDVTPLLTRWVLEDPKRAARRIGRIAAIAIGLSDSASVSSAGRSVPGTRIESAAAATWLAPLGDLSPVQQRLRAGVGTLEQRAHDPGPLPFPLVLDTSLNRAIGQVVGLGHERRFVSEYVEVFEDRARDLTVALVDDGSIATAWVGIAGRGVFVAFDVEGGTPIGLPEPGMAWAAMVAMGWYLDLAVSDSKYYKAKRPSKGLRRWEPVSPWHRQYERTTSGARVPPSAHYVRAHRRSYADRIGSEEARARAPLAIRRLMLPTDTWVRGYFVGTTPTPGQVRQNLRQASSLADLLALNRLVTAPAHRDPCEARNDRDQVIPINLPRLWTALPARRSQSR